MKEEEGREREVEGLGGEQEEVEAVKEELGESLFIKGSSAFISSSPEGSEKFGVELPL